MPEQANADPRKQNETQPDERQKVEKGNQQRLEHRIFDVQNPESEQQLSEGDQHENQIPFEHFEKRTEKKRFGGGENFAQLRRKLFVNHARDAAVVGADEQRRKHRKEKPEQDIRGAGDQLSRKFHRASRPVADDGGEILYQ